MQQSWSSYSLFPTMLLLLSIFIEQTPTPFFSSLLMPSFSLCIISYWGIRTNKLLPIWLLFTLGIISDILSGTAFGTHPLLWLLFNQFICKRPQNLIQTHQLTFHLMMFLLMSSIYWIAEWLLLSIYHSQAIPISTSIELWITTSIIYAPLHLIFEKIRHFMPRNLRIEADI